MAENDLPEQLRIRREKRESLLGRGLAPYPVSVPRTATLKEIRARFKDLEIDKSSALSKALLVASSLNVILESSASQRYVKAMAQNYKRCSRSIKLGKRF